MMEDVQTVLPRLRSFQQFYPQQFSIPYPIIKYIYQNPTYTAWKKLLKTCKFFFAKKSIFPVNYIEKTLNYQWHAEWVMTIDEKDIAYASLWLTDTLYFYDSGLLPYSLSSFIQKLAKCDIKAISIYDQRLTWNEYQFLTSSDNVTYISMRDNIITHPNGKMVTVDKLLENKEKLETFILRCRENPLLFKCDTVKNIVQIISRYKRLSYLSLMLLPESFHFPSIVKFLMENSTVIPSFSFSDDLSDNYKKCLFGFVDSVIEKPPKKIPFLDFRGFGSNADRYEKYQKLYCENQ